MKEIVPKRSCLGPRLPISPYATAVGEGTDERATSPASGEERGEEQAASRIGPTDQAAGPIELGQRTESQWPPRDSAGGGHVGGRAVTAGRFRVPPPQARFRHTRGPAAVGCAEDHRRRQSRGGPGGPAKPPGMGHTGTVKRSRGPVWRTCYQIRASSPIASGSGLPSRHSFWWCKASRKAS